MRFRLLSPACAGGCLLLLAWAAPAEPPRSTTRRVVPPPAAQGEFFEKSVRPVLATYCFGCHGPVKQKGGLRLDSRAALLTGGDSGPVVVPGQPDASLLITAVHYDASPRMPPKGKLSAEQIGVLTTWVRQGAPWPESAVAVRPNPVPPGRERPITPEERAFWSFQPVTDPAPPPVRDTAWPRTPIDRFILARLEAAGLHPSAAVDRPTLIRRATFDLIGLPPTPEEVEAFVRDERPDAFARVIDRLLASPHYGERWARHWLDVARYGEDQAHTFQARKYPNGFRYRDWLIRAFNDDLPYDRFVKEQLAADLLDGPGRPERLAALGFVALGPVYYGDPKKLDQYDDRIDTLTRGLLGLTVACARCHDHKFDPISTRDYYALAGVFASTDYAEVPLVPPEVVQEALRKQTPDEKKKKVAPKYPLIHALADAPKPVTMRVHLRGSPDNLGAEVPHRFLTILGGLEKPFTKGSGRLELAEAIASPDNPLTARVMVNRIWQHHFGKGLVRTPSNFGALGERPTHPELLDHLATRFIRSGWSIKALHREIMLSATYQQASSPLTPPLPPEGRGQDNDPTLSPGGKGQQADPTLSPGGRGQGEGGHAAPTLSPQGRGQGEGGQVINPENKLLWRMNRRCLEVEAWRDAMLAVAGTLNPAIGGPSSDLAGPDNRRRTLYGAVSRHELDNLLRLFDFPDPNITSAERTVTTVPLQQLFVLNDEFMVRNAKALAARLSAGAEPDPAARVRRAFLLLYGRPATESEVALGLSFLTGRPNSNGLSRWDQYAQVLLSTNEFLYVD